MLDLLADPHAWIALATLTALELVLGIDNIVFISILVDRLPPEQQKRARLTGLFLAMFMRVGLLLVLAWIIGLVEPLFSVLGKDISGRDLILLGGGLFLLWKSTAEIHQSIEGDEDRVAKEAKAKSTTTPIRPKRKATPIRITMIHQAFMRWLRLTITGLPAPPCLCARSAPTALATRSTPPIPRNRNSVCSRIVTREALLRAEAPGARRGRG